MFKIVLTGLQNPTGGTLAKLFLTKKRQLIESLLAQLYQRCNWSLDTMSSDSCKYFREAML